MKLWVSLFVAAVCALQLPSDGDAKSLLHQPSWKTKRQIVSHRITAQENFIGTIDYVAIILTLKRKHPHEKLRIIKDVVNTIVKDSTSKEIAIPDYPAVVIRKFDEQMNLVNYKEESDDSEAYFNAVREFMNTQEWWDFVDDLHNKFAFLDEESFMKVSDATESLIAKSPISYMKTPLFTVDLLWRAEEFYKSMKKNE